MALIQVTFAELVNELHESPTIVSEVLVSFAAALFGDCVR